MKKEKISHLPQKFGFKKGAEKFPLVILVAGASPCNAQCPHCPCTVMPEIRNTEDPYIRYEYFKKLADECAQYDCAVRVSGYGEALLNPTMIDSIEYAKSKGLEASLITNGSLLNEEKAKRLLGIGIDAIEISCDSHKKEIYEKIRVRLNFENTLKNIKNLVKLRNKMGKKTSILVSIIDQPSRNPDIEGAKKYFEKIVDKVVIRKYLTWGVLPAADCGEPYLDPKNRPPCPYPFERLMVDPAGYIRLCPYDDQKLIPPFGHISKNTIREVWRGERMNKIREGHLKRKFNKVELCNRCTDFAYRSWNYNYRKALKDARKKRDDKIFNFIDFPE